MTGNDMGPDQPRWLHALKQLFCIHDWLCESFGSTRSTGMGAIKVYRKCGLNKSWQLPPWPEHGKPYSPAHGFRYGSDVRPPPSIKETR